MHIAFAGSQTPPLSPGWHFENMGSLQSLSVQQRKEHVDLSAFLVEQVKQVRSRSQAWPHNGENVLHVPAVHVTPAG